MARRTVGFLVTLALGLLVAPLAAPAPEPGKMPRIGLLFPATPAVTATMLDAFRRGLRDLGYVEGHSIRFEPRYGEAHAERLPLLAAELVQLKVDLLLAGSTPAVLAAKDATTTIPIVMVTTGDPVATGLVASLAHPGGNLTGLAGLGLELSGKQLEVLREAVPGVTDIAVLTNPAYPDHGPAVNALEGAAQAVGVQLRVLEVHDPSELEQAFAVMQRERVGALHVLVDPLFNSQRERLLALAAVHQLPAMYNIRELVDAGGLMFYGATLPDRYRRAATYVEKILKGAKPADLPVERPTKFELVINLKTAQALGLTIPPTLLFQADEVLR
jgi:putative tryptophan/tyrosine transport system substrate-binding protein